MAACPRRRCSPPPSTPQRRAACAPFGIKLPRAEIDFAQGERARARRHRGDRAERLEGALHRPRRAGDRGRGALHGCERPLRSATVRDQGAPLRDRHRLVAGGAADPGPRRGALSHQRDDLRSQALSRASHRHRRRADRPRAGAGAPPARREGHGARGRDAARQGRSGMRRDRARASGARRRRHPRRRQDARGSAASMGERPGRRSKRPQGEETIEAAAIFWSPPAAAPTSRGSISKRPASNTRRSGIMVEQGAADDQPARLRDRRRRGRAAVHPRRRTITPAS